MMPWAWEVVGWKRSRNKAKPQSDGVRHLLTNPITNPGIGYLQR
jgi:hypothetical protein